VVRWRNKHNRPPPPPSSQPVAPLQNLCKHSAPFAAAPGENYYFAFGGCHRWEAAKRLQLSAIPAKVIRVAPSVINTYLGASSPFRTRA
jgi:hypothetical protein